jgi:hypothetical protein
VSIALILFMMLAGFRAYIDGYLFPQYCHDPWHTDKVRMHRVWISYNSAQFPKRQIIKFAPPKFQTQCATIGRDLLPEWWNYYLYCPKSMQFGNLCP